MMEPCHPGGKERDALTSDEAAQVLLRFLTVASTLGCALAALDFGAWYYALLRLYVCATGVWGLLASWNGNISIWTGVYGLIAVTYNPLAPIHLGEKALWIPINTATIVGLWLGFCRDRVEAWWVRGRAWVTRRGTRDPKTIRNRLILALSTTITIALAAWAAQRQFHNSGPSVDRLIRLATEAGRAGSHRLQVQYLERAVKLGPERPDAWRALGKALRASDERPTLDTTSDRALEAFDRAIALEASDPVNWTARGWHFQWKGGYNQAIADADHALGIDPRAFDAHLLRATALGWRGDLEPSLGEFRRAESIEADNHRLFRLRGIVFARAGDQTRAMAEYNRSIELEPKPSITYACRAVSWLRTNDARQAIADLDQALAGEPGSARYHLNRGIAHDRQGNTNAATYDFDFACNHGFTNACGWSPRRSPLLAHELTPIECWE